MQDQWLLRFGRDLNNNNNKNNMLTNASWWLFKSTDRFTICKRSWQIIPHSLGSNTESSIPKVCSEESLTGWIPRCAMFSISVKHSGAWYIRSNILKLILCSTGSQCSYSNTGMMWSEFLVPDSNLSAAFSVRRSCEILDWGRPNKRALPIIQAWTNESMNNLI